MHVTGCPSIDLAARVMAENTDGFDVYAAHGGSGVGHPITTREGYLVVLQHPVTTEYEHAAAQAAATLRAIHRLGVPAFWFWPNVDAGSDGTSKAIREYREMEDVPNIYFLKNLAPEDFLRLVKRAGCMVGNSSAGIRECAYMGVPAVNIGTRQSRRERGPNVTDVDYDEVAIAAAVKAGLAAARHPSSDLYGDGRAGEMIAELLSRAPLTIDKQITY